MLFFEQKAGLLLFLASEIQAYACSIPHRSPCFRVKEDVYIAIKSGCATGPRPGASEKAGSGGEPDVGSGD